MNPFDRLLGAAFRHNSRRLTRFARPQPSHRLPDPRAGATTMLYLHVPFCAALCPFCSFHRVAFDDARARRYFASLRREIEMAHDLGWRYSEVYVGGGTPTVIPEELARTIEFVRRLGTVSGVSIETNPADLTPALMSRMKDAGVTRVSVGVQSLSDTLLQEMGRRHKYGTAAQVVDKLAAARGVFGTLNADMIFNVPHQTEAMLEHDIALLTRELAIEQVTFYPLMTARSTRRKMDRAMGGVDFAREASLYRLILDTLPADYVPSSAWCFGRRTGTTDEYIIANDEYLGLGSGAMSYLGGTLYSSTFSLAEYSRRIDDGRFGIDRLQPLTARDRLRYYLLMKLFALRMDKAKAERQHPGLWWKLAPEIAALRAIGAVRDDGDALVLTRYGMRVWILIMREFYTAVSEFRDLMREASSVESAVEAVPMFGPQRAG